MGKKVTHIKSGREYTIVNNCMLKVNDEWKIGIIYEGIEKHSGSITWFVRTIEEFDKEFR